MPIAARKPSSAIDHIEPRLPEVQPREYKSTVIDDASRPITSLISYIQGAPWTVDWYGQIVTKHQNLRDLDPGQPNLYQSYAKINGLELRVQSPLQDSFNQENATVKVTGTAVVYPFVVPNVGDYFVAEAGYSKQGIFTVKSVERLTFNLNSAFNVDYELVGETDVEAVLYKDLCDKVGREYHFDKARLAEGLQPILRSNDYQQLFDLRKEYAYIVRSYFATFFNPRYKTLVLPGQESAIYDSNLVAFLMKIVDLFDADQIRKIQVYNGNNDPYIQQSDLWSVLLDRIYDELQYAHKKKSLVHRDAFNINSYLTGFRYTPMDYIVYPQKPDSSMMTEKLPVGLPTSFVEVVKTTNRQETPADLISGNYVTATRTVPYIKQVLCDDYYVLSEDFYNSTANLSALEILVKDYLKGNTLNLDMLYAVVRVYPTWARLEQFYYGPLLMVLIKAADEGVYS